MDSRLKIKTDVNNLLGALNMAYPGTLTKRNLLRTMLDLDPMYSEDLINRDLAYLLDKGYVRRPNKYSLDYYTLTAAGKEIADDLIDDPALEI